MTSLAERAWAAPPTDHALYRTDSAQRIRVRCSDGTDLTCWTSLPLDRPAPLTLLYFHGSGEVVSKLARVSEPTEPGGSQPTFRDLVDYILVAHGIRTVIVEYRGFGANERIGPPSMSSVLADAESCYQALRVDESKVCVMGRSIGSLPALSLARAHPGLAGVILESSLADPCAYLADKAKMSRAAFCELPVGKLLEPLLNSLPKVLTTLNRSGIAHGGHARNAHAIVRLVSRWSVR